MGCDAGGLVGGGFCCGHGGEDGGHVLGLEVGGRRLGGAGRDLAAWRADLVGSGGGGRRGAAAFSFLARPGPGPAMCEVVWVGVRGGEQFAWAAFRGGGGGSGSSGVCVGGVGGPLGGMGVPRGAGLPSAGVCGLSSVGGGEGCPAGGCVAGMCWCSGGWGRPVSRGPGVRAMVGVCGSPVEQREGGGMGGDCAAGCAVSVYVSACRALAWAVVGRAVWRRSLPSSAAAARTKMVSWRPLPGVVRSRRALTVSLVQSSCRRYQPRGVVGALSWRVARRRSGSRMVAGVRGGCSGSGGGGLDGLPGSCASTSMDCWPWLGPAGLGGAGWLLGCETGLGALWWCLGDLWMGMGGACGARGGLVDVWVMHGMVMDETLHVFPGGGVGELLRVC